jgi:alkanesulfonate monooxygenase
MITLHWYLPTHGDSRNVMSTDEHGHNRPPTLGYLSQLARAAEELGFTGVLTPTSTWCEDAWITTAALLAATSRLRFLVAMRPGSISPTLAAQMASTYQRMSNGRLLLNIVTGGDETDLARFGDTLTKDERYARTDEFLQVLRGAWSPEHLDFSGAYYDVRGATTRRIPRPLPPVYFGGASAAAERVAARHADVYLAWGEPPAMVAPRLERMRALARQEGRELRFGIRLHVIARDRAADAWAETERLLRAVDAETVDAIQQAIGRYESVGQQRMQSLHQGRRENLEVAPNLWAGIGLVREGAGTALVGSHEEVADRIAEYHALGFDELILSGHPHLEEAYHFGEGVMPVLRRRGLLTPANGKGVEDHDHPEHAVSPAASATFLAS